MQIKKGPLRQHIARFALIVQVLIFTVLYFVLEASISHIMMENYRQGLRSSAFEISTTLRHRGTLNSEIEIQNALNDMMGAPRMAYVEIVFDGKHYLPEKIVGHPKGVFIEDQTVFEHDDQIFYFSVHFEYDERDVFLNLGYAETDIESAVFSSRQAILIAMLSAALASFIFIYVFSNRLTKPLLVLTAASKSIANGTSDSKLQIKTRIEELSELSDSLADMHLKLMSRNRRLKQLASTDALTGIPNRMAFSDILSKQAAGNESGGRFALIMVDIDKFKDVNDNYGHVVGDHVINEVAKRLNNACREKDFVARIGGDEFALVLHDASEGRVQHFCRLLNERVAESIQMNDLTLNMSISIGATLIDNVLSIEDAIHQADMAMYESKRKHVPFVLFGMDSFSLSLRETLLKKTLKSALEKDKNAYSKLGVYVLYQPKFDAQNFKLTGVEALIRWDHAEFGSIPTEQLIAIAESELMIQGMTDFVLCVAAEQARDWADLGHALPISVNISAIDLLDPNFEKRLMRIYERFQIAHNLIELEISEHVLSANLERITELIDRLKNKGISIVIDRFGYGDVSAQTLQSLPLKSVKIDRRFVMAMLKSQESQTQVESIIQQVRQLDLSVIADGVESEAMIKVLNDAECDEVQGFHFSRPVQASFIETNFLNE